MNFIYTYIIRQLSSEQRLPKPENRKNHAKAERDVNQLIKNLVRQGLNFYHSEDQNFPCRELADRVRYLLQNKPFNDDIIQKVQRYLSSRYSAEINYTVSDLEKRIEARLKHAYEIFMQLSPRLGDQRELRKEIIKSLR